MFGEYGLTSKTAKNNENWNGILNWINGIVKKSMDDKAKNPNKQGEA